mmetsp:Transcript_9359/g.23606  ORF Transcript_9359/g.23606 Transcript_9359/m.23606 type:complete len:526 (+) Transcript_9359:91-1668(+)
MASSGSRGSPTSHGDLEENIDLPSAIDDASKVEDQPAAATVALTTAEARFTRKERIVHIVKHRLRRLLAFAFFWVVPWLIDRIGVDFPASLICMLTLAVLLLALEIIGKRTWAQSIFMLLSPGQQFLVKWSALFFLPAMVELPVKLSDGFTAWDIGRMLIFMVVGWLIQVSSLACISSLLHQARQTTCPRRRGQGSQESADEEAGGTGTETEAQGPNNAVKDETSAKDASLAVGDDQHHQLAPPKWEFSKACLVLWTLLWIIGLPMTFVSPENGERLFLLAASIVGATVAGLLPPRYRLVFAPVLVALAFTFAAAAAWSPFVGSSFIDVLKRFNKGELEQGLEGLGVGRILASCLPAFVASLSLVVYERRDVLWQNMFIIISTCICGLFLGLVSSPALAKAFVLPADLARPSSVRYFSVPLAIQSAAPLEINDAMAASYAVVSGLLGATLGWPWMRKVCRARDASIMGICIGGVSHGQGTAMLGLFDSQAMAFSSVSFVITGVLGSLLVRVPFIAHAIIGITGPA